MSEYGIEVYTSNGYKKADLKDVIFFDEYIEFGSGKTITADLSKGEVIAIISTMSTTSRHTTVTIRNGIVTLSGRSFNAIKGRF